MLKLLMCHLQENTLNEQNKFNLLFDFLMYM